MRTFQQLYNVAQAIDTSATPYPTQRVLDLLSDTKGVCESLDDFKYKPNASDVYDTMVCRDLCVSGLNSAGSSVAIDARFMAVKACLKTYTT